MKQLCNYCSTEKELEDFKKQSKKVSGKACICKECHNRKQRERYAADPTFRKNNTPEKKRHRRDYIYKRLYGITILEYEYLYDTQGGKCLICGKYQDRLYVDHDHEKKTVRGLLCIQCNSAIGLIYERVDLLERMIGYINGNISRLS
jgi:hypothetical protein